MFLSGSVVAHTVFSANPTYVSYFFVEEVIFKNDYYITCLFGVFFVTNARDFALSRVQTRELHAVPNETNETASV